MVAPDGFLTTLAFMTFITFGDIAAHKFALCNVGVAVLGPKNKTYASEFRATFMQLASSTQHTNIEIDTICDKDLRNFTQTADNFCEFATAVELLVFLTNSHRFSRDEFMIFFSHRVSQIEIYEKKVSQIV